MCFDSGTFIREYEILSKLGEGSGGFVYKAMKGKKNFALKFISVSAIQSFYGEVKFMLMLQQTENISVKCYDSFVWQNQYCVIVMEEFRIDLLDYLLTNTFSIDDVKHIFKQICSHVNKMHCLHIYHRDLKPENILLNNENCIRITDFANCIYTPDTYCIPTGNIGTYQYNAPELSRCKIYNAEKADVWSIGVILHVLLTGKWPFVDANSVFNTITFCLSESLNGDEELISLLTSMLRIEPTERPSLSDILVHPWLVGSRRRTNQEKTNLVQKISSSIGKLLK